MQAALPFFFWVIAGLTGLCAVATVVTQNIVRSATWLLFTLAGTSGIFFLLGADLVGAIQLLVYVGGTLVLVVFGVMLTAQGPFINIKASSAEWAISATVGLLLLGVLSVAVAAVKVPDRAAEKQAWLKKDDKGPLPAAVQYSPDRYQGQNPADSNHSSTIGQGFLGVGVGPAHLEKGKPVRTSYLLPFELVSVHLLVVLIGAAYLARAKRRKKAGAP